MATARPSLNNEVDFSLLLQGRRFGAVAVPSRYVSKAMANGALYLAESSTESEFTVAGWRAYRLASDFSNSYFSTVSKDQFAVGKDLFRQEYYVAVAPDGIDVALIISPFVRLLDRILTRVSRVQDAQSPLTYAVPDLDEVFRAFEDEQFNFMTATRISVKKDEDPIVDLVSLSGRNPLKSNLREDLRKAGNAYSVRMAVGPKGQQINVYLDRFGNLSWFQRKEADLWAPLRALGALVEFVSINEVASRPTKRLITSPPVTSEDEGV